METAWGLLLSGSMQGVRLGCCCLAIIYDTWEVASYNHDHHRKGITLPQVIQNKLNAIRAPCAWNLVVYEAVSLNNPLI